MLRLAVLFLALAMGFVPDVQAQVIAERTALTFEGVKVVAEAAAAEAMQNNWNVVIVVADANGDLLHLQRLDGAHLGSLQLAQEKARTAARYRRPSKDFADWLHEGGQAALALPGAIPSEGGLPIVVEGEVIGAIGVNGVRAAYDTQIAQAGIDALLAQIDR
ncbi:MAG: hypothetical protein Rubg2KO_26380 [Rubricoccaceae bacterium]